jgi:hypothetical protein
LTIATGMALPHPASNRLIAPDRQPGAIVSVTTRTT